MDQLRVSLLLNLDYHPALKLLLADNHESEAEMGAEAIDEPMDDDGDLINDADCRYYTGLEQEMGYFYDSNIPMLEPENMMECIHDGNELFRLFAMKFYEEEENHHLVREDVIGMLTNDPIFEDMFDNQYIELMKEEGTPATALEAWALAKKFNLHMLLVLDGQKVIHEFGVEKVMVTFMFGSWNMAKNFDDLHE